MLSDLTKNTIVWMLAPVTKEQIEKTLQEGRGPKDCVQVMIDQSAKYPAQLPEEQGKYSPTDFGAALAADREEAEKFVAGLWGLM